MYKVLLVDDEKWVLESLKVIVPWEENGFKVIGQALNGFEAYNKIIKLKPKVIIVDIQMPSMNGLELIKKVKEFDKNIQFIVVSGYAEFKYAQESMKYGVAGYCLKPFDIDEMVELLNKIKQTLIKEKLILENKLFYMIETFNENNTLRLKQLLKDLNFDWSKTNNVSLAISMGEINTNIPQNLQFISLNLGKNKFLYFIESSGLKYLLCNTTSTLISLGISSKINSLKNIPNAINEAEISVFQYFIDKNQINYYNNNNNTIDNYLNKLDESIRKKDIYSIKDIICNITKGFQQGKYNIKHALKLYNWVILINCNNSNNEEDCFNSYSQLSESFCDVYDMITYLLDLIIGNLSSNCTMSNIKNETFKVLIKYLNQNYFNNISITSLAEEFHITPNYISQLFRKEGKCTFTSYLTNIRMEHASLLLKNTDTLINDIAEKVGYNDYFYFAKVFKKQYGKTAMQYRNIYSKNIN